MNTPSHFQAVYLDHNATTPVCDAARQAALAVMSDCFGNPSSTHSEGLVARQVLDQARAAARAALRVPQGELIFGSGATEALHTAVFSALLHCRAQRQAGHATGRRLVYGATEHKAVEQALQHWNQHLGLNLEVCALPVDRHGRHDLQLLAQWLPETALLCTMAANNETGVVSDLDGIEACLQAHSPHSLWLVDGVQALGKLPLHLARRRVDYAAFSGHKLYAPKGVGLLYVRPGAPYTPLMVGGGQEAELRAGTENLPGIAAMGAVLKRLAHTEVLTDLVLLEQRRAQLLDALQAGFDQVRLHAPLDLCLPTTLNFSVPGLSSKTLMNLLDAAGVQVSAGSACSSGKAAGSPVLKAMGLDPEALAGAVRLSFGPLTPAQDIERACQRLRACADLLHLLPKEPAEAAELAAAPAPASTGAPAPAPSLSWAALPAFLQQHPGALLVDVRDGFEVAAAPPVVVGTHRAVHWPWSTWCDQTACAAPADQTLVVFCRSGARSAEAVHRLQALGRRAAVQVQGGLALRERSLP